MSLFARRFATNAAAASVRRPSAGRSERALQRHLLQRRAPVVREKEEEEGKNSIFFSFFSLTIDVAT
jgi:hypothetical protein